MKKIILTGASGFLGFHLIKHRSSDVELFGLYQKNKPNENGALFLPCDIADYRALGDLIEDIEPDAIIHTAAFADAGFCEANKELSRLVNVQASENLAGIAADYNIPFVFTSTDMVFDGKKGNYTEEDAPNPLNIYGEHKVIAEERILQIYPASLVVRLPLLFGELAAGQNNFIASCVAQNREGKSIKLFTDEYRSICGANSIAKGIYYLLGKTNGLLHLGGGERISRFDFGLEVASIFGLDKSLIVSSKQADVQFSYQRPKDVSLDSKKAQTLGFEPLAINKELAAIAATI